MKKETKKNEQTGATPVVSGSKPVWWKPAIKANGHSSCLCCPETSEILNLDTKLYQGFGGWNILKNGQEFFSESQDTEFEDCKDIAHIETLISEDNESEYIANLFLPLRDAKYQRHSKNNWVLIEKGPGFA